MHYFLDTSFDPNIGVLNEDESYHARKSLRVQVGDEIKVGDGKGNVYLTRISAVDPKELELEVLKFEHFEPEEPKLIIALALTKNPSRFEWFLEKATEMGIHAIIPMTTSRTERPRFKFDRAERIVLAATKQSQRAHLPILRELTRFEEVLNHEADQKFIAHCEDEDDRIEFAAAITNPTCKSIHLLIGPEGDFTPEEIKLAKDSGFDPVRLGPNRLRTETAGVFAAAVLYGLRKD